MSTRALIVLLSVGAFVVGYPSIAAAESQSPDGGALELFEGLRAARPDGRTIEVRDLELVRDVFEIRFVAGHFHLLEPVAGATPGAVFIGRGSYKLTPATEVERRALAVRTGEPGLESYEDEFTSAILLFADGTEKQLMGGRIVVEGQPDSQATMLVEERFGVLSRGLAADPHFRLLRSRLNDEGIARGPFYAFVSGGRLAAAVIAVDPMGVLDGEASCLVAETVENGGFWYSSHLLSELESGAPPRRRRLVDAEHYAVESRVARSTDIEGTTTVRFSSQVPKLRVLPFALHPSLLVEKVVALGPNSEIPVGLLRGAGGPSAVLFPVPLRPGSSLSLKFSYAGDGVLIDEGVKIYRVEARSDWYPKLGGFQDRATYDLTFSVPKGNTVVAVGEAVGAKAEGNEVVSIWKAEKPITVAGFNYGDFARFEQRENETGMNLEVYATTGEPDIITEINRDLQAASAGLDYRGQVEVATNDGLTYVDTYTGPSSIGISSASLADAAMADATNSIRVFTRFFGPIDTSRMAITQQSQWNFGQAWPSLVYLPYLAGIGSALRVEIGLADYAGFVDEVGIHEISHQWWGHHVGWESYRDQWLSEGFAEFSTALVLELTRGQEAYQRFWEQRRRAVLGRSQGAELAPYVAGPIVLGFRASSEKSPYAATALTYSKGGYVLHMLRMLMRDHAAQSDERFFDMMKDFAGSFAGRAATTEDFKRIVQKHMVPELNAAGDGTVDWFFDQWVYGTEVPTYQAEVTIEKAGKDKYRLVGSLSQKGVSDRFLALVPAYVDLGKGGFVQFGRAPFKGEMSHELDLTLDLPRKPKGVVMNAHNDVLAFD